MAEHSHPDVCPQCGNPDVGHEPNWDYCIAKTDPEHPEWGCGWMDVHAPPVTEQGEYKRAKGIE